MTLLTSNIIQPTYYWCRGHHFPKMAYE